MKSKFRQGIFEPVNKEKYTGKLPIVGRSSWELNYMRCCDINENVIAWGSESIKITYYSPVDKKQHTYYPDFILQVKKPDGSLKTQVIEIKPSRQTKPPKLSRNRNVKTMLYESKTYAINQAKWAAAREFCRCRNWDFFILTEKDLK